MDLKRTINRPRASAWRAGAVVLAAALLAACSDPSATADAGPGGDGAATADGAATDGNTSPDALASGDAGAAPEVRAKATYTVKRARALVYARGIVNSNWGASAGKEVDLLLDLFTPEGHNTGLRPGILFIHGGGFKGGTRNQSALVDQASYLAARGWVAASIDYRLAGTQGVVPAAWAQAVKKAAPTNAAVGNAMYLAGRDAKAAVRWLHANAAKYRVHPNHIAVAGGSAGAFTAVGVGASEPADFRDELTDAQDRTRKTTHLQASSRVAAIVDYWGGPTLITALELAYGHRRFGPGDPPLLIIHGTADATVKYSQAQELEKQWKASGAPYKIYPLKGAGHGPWNAKVNGKALVELAFDFLVARQGLVVR